MRRRRRWRRMGIFRRLREVGCFANAFNTVNVEAFQSIIVELLQLFRVFLFGLTHSGGDALFEIVTLGPTRFVLSIGDGQYRQQNDQRLHRSFTRSEVG